MIAYRTSADVSCTSGQCVWNVDDQRLDADQAPDEYQDCEGVWGRIRMSKL